jgi:hypothetical protein
MAHTTARSAERKVEQTLSQPLMEKLMRFGYVARGVLFAIIGYVALQIAFGRSDGKAPDQGGALAAIVSQPNGQIILAIIVVGLAAFSLWGFVRAIFDPLHRGKDASGIVERLGFALSGISYGLLIYPGIQLVMGSGGGPQNQTQKTQDVTAQVLAHPIGPWLIAFVGLLVIGWSVAQFVSAYTGKFQRDFRFGSTNQSEKQIAILIAKIGIAARAFVFLLVGAFLIQSALQNDPSRAKGLDAALLSLAQWSGGPWVLAAAALGLICFGIYSILFARWVDVK